MSCRILMLAFALVLAVPARAQQPQQQAPPIGFALSDDARELTITFPANAAPSRHLKASEVDEFLSGIAAFRSRMVPPIPQRDPEPGQQIHLATPGRWYVQSNPPAGLTLMILDPGFGWVAISLNDEQAASLVKTILRLRPTIPIRQ